MKEEKDHSDHLLVSAIMNDGQIKKTIPYLLTHAVFIAFYDIRMKLKRNTQQLSQNTRQDLKKYAE